MEDRSFGSFSISRKLENSWLHPSRENRKFTKYEAWLWIIEHARYFCSEPTLVSEKLIIIPRGYFSTTVDFLTTTFKWNVRTTEKFLKLLEKDLKIKRYKINAKCKRSYTLIKVNKYNDYQPKICDKCNSKYKTKCKTNCNLKYKLYKKDKESNKKDKNVLGEFKNIFLSDENLEKLKTIYGDKFNQAVEKLSSYIKANGKAYKDFYAVLNKHNWVYKEVMTNTIKGSFTPKDEPKPRGAFRNKVLDIKTVEELGKERAPIPKDFTTEELKKKLRGG